MTVIVQRYNRNAEAWELSASFGTEADYRRFLKETYDIQDLRHFRVTGSPTSVQFLIVARHEDRTLTKYRVTRTVTKP